MKTKRNRKLLFLGVTLGVFAFGLAVLFLPSNFVGAQESSGVEIVAAPQIFVEKLNIGEIDENSGKITGGFTIVSQEEKNYYDVYAAIYLYQTAQKTLSAKEENLYDSSNWNLVASYPETQPIIVKAGEVKEKKYSLNIPHNRPLGNYLLKAQLFLKEGGDLGVAISPVFQLGGNNHFFVLSNPSVIKNNKEYGAKTGVDFSQGEKPEISVFARNISNQKIEAKAQVSIFRRNQFGEKIKEFQLEKSFILSAGQQDLLKTDLPSADQAGSFLVQLQLFEKVGGLAVSAPVQFRYVVRGESGKILELFSDKESYRKGENSLVGIKVIGPADSVLLNDRGIWMENPQRKNFEASLEIKLLSLKGKPLADKKVIKVNLDGYAREYEVKIPLREETANYVLKAVLLKDGKILDSKSVTVGSEKKPTGDSKPRKENQLAVLVLALLVLIAGLAAIFLKKKKSKIFVFLAFGGLSGGLLFAGINKAKAYTVVENWSSPSNGSRYNTTSNSSDVVYFQANPEVRGCSNKIRSVGATGFYLNGRKLSSGLAGIGLPTVSLPNARLGANQAEIRFTIYFVYDLLDDDLLDKEDEIYTSQRTFYIDTARVIINVYESTSAGLRGIASASVNCGGRLGTTNSSGYVEFYSVSPGSITCTASASGYESNSVTFDVNQISNSKSIILAPAAVPPPPPPGAPSCSLSFSPSSITAGGSSTATWSSANDADGQLPYSCSGDIGSGTVGSSGSVVITPSATQTCTLTAQNSAGQTATCQATINVGSVQPVGGYMCGVGYNCQSCPSYGQGSCVYQNLSSCQYNCVRPDPPTCRCQLDPNSIFQGETTTLFWSESGDSDGNLDLSITGAYLGWEYRRSASSASGHLVPRCSCDTSTTSEDCQWSFSARTDDPLTCYDQYIIRTNSRSYIYNKTKINQSTLQPVNPVYEFLKSSTPIWVSPYLRLNSCSCDTSPLTADCPSSFRAEYRSSNICYDVFSNGSLANVYYKRLLWSGSQNFLPILDSNPVSFNLLASNAGGTGQCSCQMTINPAFNLAVSIAGDGYGNVSSGEASGGIHCFSGSTGTCQKRYPQGASVTLTVVNSPGSVFSGWSGSCSGDNAICSLTMDRDKAVTASFSRECFCSGHADRCPDETWNDNCGNPVCAGGTKDCGWWPRYWKEVGP